MPLIFLPTSYKEICLYNRGGIIVLNYLLDREFDKKNFLSSPNRSRLQLNLIVFIYRPLTFNYLFFSANNIRLKPG